VAVPSGVALDLSKLNDGTHVRPPRPITAFPFISLGLN
jgi:hypothetical protein